MEGLSRVPFIYILVLMFPLILSSCNASGPDLVDNVSTVKQAKETVVGKGSVNLTMFLSYQGSMSHQSRDYRDGAALAVEELAAEQVSLHVRPSVDGDLKLQAGDNGPAISFLSLPRSDNTATYSIRTDAIDSALEGVRGALKAGKKRLLVVAPQSFSDKDFARIELGVKNTKMKVIGQVKYHGDISAIVSQLTERKEMLSSADALIILGADNLPSQIARALKLSSIISANTLIIGNIDWARSNFSHPALEGTLIAFPDQKMLEAVSKRFHERYGRFFTVDAAYGYDALAVMAGVLRVNGDSGLTKEALANPAGFKGALGLFRFLSNGSVERPMTLYSLSKGSLKENDPEPDGF